jgi:Amt family ammonium transporter
MELDPGTTAWVLASAAMVLLMTPGLAFFYGGMTRSKSVLNMLMMSFSAIGIVSIIWVLYGYTLAFGVDAGGHGLIGNLDLKGLHGITAASVTNGLSDFVFVAFQLMFAIITLALISGAVADRMKFGAWVAFSILWISLVYFPVAHWVFAFGTPVYDTGAKGGAGAAAGYVAGTGGWIVSKLGALDFAGGTAVHMNAGAAALALVLVLGKRVGFRRDPMRPHNLPLVMIGTGLLWFGWFGFNAGSALGANGLAGLAMVNTQVATAAGLVGWIAFERLRDGHATTLGAASGAVAGLVAITPACGSVTPVGAILHRLLHCGDLEAQGRVRRCSRRRGRPPRRRSRRHVAHRVPRQRHVDGQRRPAWSVLRRRRKPARQASGRGRRGARLLVRPDLPHRAAHQVHHRLADQ